MRRIRIAQRFLPYCHDAGMTCLLPGTAVSVRVYPTSVECTLIGEGAPQPLGTIPIPVEGPVHGLTGSLDLERGSLRIWGESRRGYFRYRLSLEREPEVRLILLPERSPEQQTEHGTLFGKETSLLLPSSVDAALPTRPRERLSLGCHKAQDWTLIRRRQLMAEWMPLWHWCGQWHRQPADTCASWIDESSLRGMWARALATSDADAATAAATTLYQTAFDGFFVPTPHTSHLMGAGLLPTAAENATSLLADGALLIRSLFVIDDDADTSATSAVKLLPTLPRQLHAGRYLGALCCQGLAQVNFEWSKHLLRRAIISPLREGTLQLSWQKALQRCRLRRYPDGIDTPLHNGHTLALTPGHTYHLDCFE